MHLDLLPADGTLSVERCTLFDSVPGPLQSVQRAEMWGVILALQSSSAIHLGVDNLNVVRHVSGILAGRSGRKPFELCTDCDLLYLIEAIVRQRGADTVCISKAKGHADEEMVRTGRVRAVDKICNDLADRAADFGRRRVLELVIDLRSTAACASWYLLALELHRFFIAIARAVVNEDGHSGLALHPTVWSEGVSPRGARLFSLPGSILGFLVLLDFGVMVLLVGLVLRLQLRMFGAGLFQWTFG